MPPGAHAILSASSAHRWINCPPSARLEQQFPNRSSPAAAEGSAAHALGEAKIRKELMGEDVEMPTSEYDGEEMDRHTDDYLAFVAEQLSRFENPLLYIEQRLDFSEYVPDGFGTGDCVIIGDDEMHVIDFKYGLGVHVEAERNPQMMLYALGALSNCKGICDIRKVSMTVFQPRRENISTWTETVDDLRNWAEHTLAPAAKQAFAGEGQYSCGDWCVFCRAKQTCRARAEANLSLLRYELERPPLLSDDEIDRILGQLEGLVRWAEEIRSYARHSALRRGKHWNGFKLVEEKTFRRYTNEKAVAEAVLKLGIDPYEKKLLGIGAMAKLLGRERFDDLLGHLIEKPRGKPTLVPITDRRPEILIDTENKGE